MAAETREHGSERERRKWLAQEEKEQRIGETKRWNDRKERKRGN